MGARITELELRLGERIDRLDGRIDRLDGRIGATEGRFVDLLNERFDAVMVGSIGSIALRRVDTLLFLIA
jgi:hypothetical protein